jgi:predicted membrane protein (TIGR00267 family)
MKQNKENHFTANDKIRDLVIGLSDGLTVPFALAAGLTGAIAASKLIVTAGLAEIAAGSISMGLGGYLAAKSEIEHYHRERGLEEKEVIDTPEVEEKEVRDILEAYELTKEQTDPLIQVFKKNHTSWVNFMMRNELGLEKPNPRRVVTSSITIAASYAIGGFVPLSPYFFIKDAHHAVIPSIVLTLIALFIFGFFKAYISGTKILRSAIEMVVIGGIAAGAAYLIARAIT